MHYPKNLHNSIDQPGNALCAANPRDQIAEGQSDISRFQRSTIVISSCVSIEMLHYLPCNVKIPIGEKRNALKYFKPWKALKDGFDEGI